MKIVSCVAAALQRVLGETAEQSAKDSQAVVRQRKFTGASLVATFVLGFLRKPDARPEDLARTAAELGVDVTPQAVKKRYTARLVECFRGVLERAVREAVPGEARSIPLLQKFTKVRIGDSSGIALPDEWADRFPGCGGVSGSGKAAAKLQVELDQIDGQLTLALESGRDSDAKSALMQTVPDRGSLTIRDLGYFSLDWFLQLIAAGAFFISRLQPKTTVFDRDGVPLDLFQLLDQHMDDGPFDRHVLIGQTERVPCRLIAWRAPADVVARRRRKARRRAQKEGRTVTAEHLAWLAYTVFITNCDAQLLAWKEVVVLYRLRWQIELLFKLWKSHNLLAHDDRHDPPERRMAKFYARLIGVLVQHWLLLTSAWTAARHSLRKAAVVLQEQLLLILTALTDLAALCQVLARLQLVIDRPARLGKRKKRPGTFQLLENPELLEYTC